MPLFPNINHHHPPHHVQPNSAGNVINMQQPIIDRKVDFTAANMGLPLHAARSWMPAMVDQSS